VPVIFEAAAQAGDGSPGQQCTELMSYVIVHQAYTFGVPIMVENVRQIDNEKDGYHLLFLGLRLSM